MRPVRAGLPHAMQSGLQGCYFPLGENRRHSRGLGWGGLYDRTGDEITLDEVERITI